MRNFEQCVEVLLTRNGSLIERQQDDSLCCIIPEHIAKRINVPELTIFQSLSIESEYFEPFYDIASQGGRRLFISIPDTERGKLPSNHFEILQSLLPFSNATFRLREIESARALYHILHVKVIVSSDEKREEIVSIAFNGANTLSHTKLYRVLLDLLSQDNSSSPFEEQSHSSTCFTPPICNYVAKAIENSIKIQYAPFIGAMNNRLQRDALRIQEYYTSLKSELTIRRTRKSKEKKNNNLQNAHSFETITAQEEVFKQKLESIDRELEAKIADLKRKFSLQLEVVPLQLLSLSLPVYRAKLALLRRKFVRTYFLDWNSLTKRFDEPICEKCNRIRTHGSLESFAISDDTLEMVCTECILERKI